MQPAKLQRSSIQPVKKAWAERGEGGNFRWGKESAPSGRLWAARLPRPRDCALPLRFETGMTPCHEQQRPRGSLAVDGTNYLGS